MADKFLLANIKEIIENNEEMLRSYVELLIRANEAARLTGPKDAETLWNEHILDCACAVPALPTHGSVIDVGTGGGLPGIVFAICRRDLKFTLLDSISRKCIQVEKMANLLGLKNVRVVCSRSEDFANKNMEKYDAACARAVCTAGILAEYLMPFVKQGGTLIAFKGPKAQEEIEAVGDKWKSIGLSIPSIEKCGAENMQHFLVIWKKIARSCTRFPRKPGMAEKFPWFEAGRKK